MSRILCRIKGCVGLRGHVSQQVKKIWKKGSERESNTESGVSGAELGSGSLRRGAAPGFEFQGRISAHRHRKKGGEMEWCNAYLPWKGRRRCVFSPRGGWREEGGGRRVPVRPRGVGVRILSLLLLLSHLFTMPPKSSIHWQRSTLGRLRILGTQLKSTTRPGRAPVTKTTLGPKGIDEYCCTEEQSL
jgi:hypothetical protein